MAFLFESMTQFKALINDKKNVVKELDSICAFGKGIMCVINPYEQYYQVYKFHGSQQ